MLPRTKLLAVALALTVGLATPLSAQGLKLRETLTGPAAKAYSLAYSPDGKVLAAGLVNGDIYLWDTATKKERAVLKGHTFVAVRVRFSPDGSRLASAGGIDGTARLWDVATGKPLHTLTLPKKTTAQESVSDVAFHPDGKTLAACGFRGRLPLWDVATGKELGVLDGEGARCLAYSPDGKLLARGSDPQSVRLRDLATGQEQFVAGPGMVSVFALAFSPDSKVLAMAGNHRGDAPPNSDNVIRLWDVAARKERARLQGHRLNNVYQVAFSPDGKLLASTCQDRTVRLWEVATGKEILTQTKDEAVLGLAFSPDGRTLAMTAGKTVTLWAFPQAG